MVARRKTSFFCALEAVISLILTNFANRIFLLQRDAPYDYPFSKMNAIAADNIPDCLPASSGAGSAVGVPVRHWYVAQMKHNNIEKATSQRLSKKGYEVYVATQQEVRIWSNGRKKKVDRVVIPSKIFIHCTEAERRDVVYDPSISRFMTDKAGMNVVNGKIAVIPPDQIERLRFILGQSDIPVEFVAGKYKPGDKVRVIRGSLKGLEGEVISDGNGKSELVVSVDVLGCAKLSVSTIDLERIA